MVNTLLHLLLNQTSLGAGPQQNAESFLILSPAFSRVVVPCTAAKVMRSAS